MHWIDWSIVGVYLVWIVWDGIRLSRGTHEIEGYFLANRSLPWWAVGPVGDGHADERHHARRHHGAGLCRRHPVRAVLLRPAAGDGDSLADGGAVLSSRARVHGVRVPRAAVRRRHPVAHELPVPDLARHVVRRHHRGACRHSVGRPRLEPDADDSRHRRPHRVLHDEGRRAGRDVDRRQTDGGHRLRPGIGGRGARLEPARCGRPRIGAARGRQRGQTPGHRLPVRSDTRPIRSGRG